MIVAVAYASYLAKIESIRILTIRRFNWKCVFSRSSSNRDTRTTVESVSCNTFTLGDSFVVDCVSWASPTLPINIEEPTIADTGINIKVENFVLSTYRSADGELSIVVVGVNAISTNTFD